MRTFAEIRANKSIRICEAAPEEGCWGYVQVGKSVLKFIASWGINWDHVSVSRDDRTPRWEEMCAVKDAFFHEEECVVQYHPPHSRYVNYHEHCLHLWRQQGTAFPMPPLMCV